MAKLTEVSGVVLYQPVRRGKRRSRSDAHSVKSVRARTARANAFRKLKIACKIPLWNDSFGRVQGLCDFALNPNKAAPAGVTAPTEA
jgi:hypothetical protein